MALMCSVGQWLAECLWPSTSGLWLAVESLGPDGFSSNLPELEAGGLCILSDSPVSLSVGLRMEVGSWCNEASSEMLVDSVDKRQNARKVSIGSCGGG